MSSIERKGNAEKRNSEYKGLANSIFNEIKERVQNNFDTSGVLELQDYRPTYSLSFDTDRREAVFELEVLTGFTDELRRYQISENSLVKKGGYLERHAGYPYGITYFTDDKQEYLDRGLEEDEYLADPQDVDFYELDTLAKLVFAPEENAQLVESLPRFPF